MSPDLIITSGLLELYVSGALSPNEMQEVDALAEAHPVIQAELDKIEEALIQYALLQSPVKAPDIRAEIAASIHEVPHEQVSAPAAAPVTNKVRKEKVHREPEEQTSTPFPERERSGYGGGVIILLIILLLGAGAAAYYFYDQWQKSLATHEEVIEQEQLAVQTLEEAKTEQEELENELNIYKKPPV